MTLFGYNSRYLLKDGIPWFPVMGEFHYSRYQEDLWEESLYKVKAGGISIVSTYVIWIHHEEEEDVYDFTGCRNLRKFLELCRKAGLYVFLRLGPWVHGEVRNGGFPDWLLHKADMEVRSDDLRYLFFVKRYWQQVYGQAKELLLTNGGPIIGIQIENEYGNGGGLDLVSGERHMKTLTVLAKDIGFEVPYYTATGWGGACTGGLLPVMSGYCEAPWDKRTTELEANPNFVFSFNRNPSFTGCDRPVKYPMTFREEEFPFLTAELGGGLQVTKHRRPVAEGKDTGAMSLVRLGSGAAMLGYYMYHGGSNPKGKLSTLQESRETGYANDLPEINYDFNAPIRQFGTISDGYREIRMLSYFLQDFGSDFAACEADMELAEIQPEDTHTLRVSCRHDDRHGYLFFNNYQRRREMEAHLGIQFIGRCISGAVKFPKIDIQSGQYAFFPYNMKLDNAILESAVSTPLCRLQLTAGAVFVFYGDWKPEFVWKGIGCTNVLQLSRKEAMKAAKVRLDQDYLILSDDFVYAFNGTLHVWGCEVTVIKSYPALSNVPEGFKARDSKGVFAVYERRAEGSKVKAEYALLRQTEEFAVYEITISCAGIAAFQKNGVDIMLSIDFAGESMDIFQEGKKINDYFYTGQTALLSLAYFGFPMGLEAIVYTLRSDSKIFLEKWPVMVNEKACGIYGVTADCRFQK